MDNRRVSGRLNKGSVAGYLDKKKVTECLSKQTIRLQDVREVTGCINNETARLQGV